MRILVSGTTYYPALNGQAIFTINLAEGLAKRGHEIMMVYPSERGFHYRGERNGVKLVAVGSVSLRRWHENAYFTPFPGREVRQVIDSYQPEIVHIQDHYFLSRSFMMLTEKNRIKTVGTNHFMPENLAPYVPFLAKYKSFYNQVSWRWMMEVYNRVDVATAQSQAAANLVKKQGLRTRILPVSCGIDLTRFQPNPNTDRLACRIKYGLDPQKTIFLFVGRVDKEKKLDVLLHAFHDLNRCDIQLAIAGQGSAMNDLQSLARELSLEETVKFTGFVAEDELPALLNSVDVFTMPSEAELLSIATLEAMACGRPVLLADAVALPELVTIGVNGYLFKPGDSAAAGGCIALLADHPKNLHTMGKASMEKARFHSLENALQQYEMIYESLLKDTSLPELQK